MGRAITALSHSLATLCLLPFILDSWEKAGYLSHMLLPRGLPRSKPTGFPDPVPPGSFSAPRGFLHEQHWLFFGKGMWHLWLGQGNGQHVSESTALSEVPKPLHSQDQDPLHQDTPTELPGKELPHHHLACVHQSHLEACSHPGWQVPPPGFLPQECG